MKILKSLPVIALMFLIGCSGSFSLKGKLCLQDVLCANKGNAIVHTVIGVLEGGRVLFGYNGLPCGEIDFGFDGGFGKGDILTLTTKDIGNGDICPVKVSNYGTEARDYPIEEVTITTEQIKYID